MAPVSNVMLLRIRTRALEGDQEVIRDLSKHFSSPIMKKTLLELSKEEQLGAVQITGAARDQYHQASKITP